MKVFVLLWKGILARGDCQGIFVEFMKVIGVLLVMVFFNYLLPLLPQTRITPDFEIMNFERGNGTCATRQNGTVIVYEPASLSVNDLMNKVTCSNGYDENDVKPGIINEDKFDIGVKFKEIKKNPIVLDYTIYPSGSSLFTYEIWRHPNLLVDLFSYNDPSVSSIIELQQAIDDQFLRLQTISTVKAQFKNTEIFRKRVQLFNTLIPFILYALFSIEEMSYVVKLVKERSSGINEMLIILGVKKSEIWIAAIMDSLLFSTHLIVLATFFLVFPLHEDSFVFEFVHPAWIIGVFYLGAINALCFLYNFSILIKNEYLGMLLPIVIWVFILIFYSYEYITFVESSRIFGYLMSLIPQICLLKMFLLLFEFEKRGKEVRLLEKLSHAEEVLTMTDYLIITGLEIIFYSLLRIYLDEIWPNKYGLSRPFCFCFTRSYWKPKKVDIESGIDTDYSNEKEYEKVPENLKAGISVQNVTKIYNPRRKGHVVALDNVSINFYEGEISGILGQNGAGKTTLVSAISGMTSVTSGKIFINGYDLSINQDQARKSMGLCPQHNLLLDYLTTSQNLHFFGKIKGIPQSQVKQVVMEILTILELKTVANVRGRNLSGGQKRKLCLAFALIGKPQVVLLDEPTAGVDINMRKEIWEIISKLRGKTTILLTTHLLEDADVLCDRIAIMKHGRVQNYGTPLYLKSKLKTGYTLFVEITNMRKTQNIKATSDFIRSKIKEAHLKYQNVSTLVYQIPDNETTSLLDLLEGLDDKKKKKEIASYVLTISTLQDVVSRAYDEWKTDIDPNITDKNPIDQPQKSELNPVSLICIQLSALLFKKFTYFKRRILIFLISFVLLAGLVALFLLILPKLRNKNQTSSEDPLPYSLHLYGNLTILYSSPPENKNALGFLTFIKENNLRVRKVENINKEIHKLYDENFHEYARSIIAMEFTEEKISLLYSKHAILSAPIALNILHNSFLKSEMGTIKTSLSLKYTEKVPLSSFEQFSKCSLSSLPLVLMFQSIVFLVGPLEEKRTGLKTLQTILVPKFFYYLAHLFFDLILLVIFAFLFTIIFVLADEENMNVLKNYSGRFISGLLLTSVSFLLIVYVTVNMCKKIETAVTIFTLFWYIEVARASLKDLFIGVMDFPFFFHPAKAWENGIFYLCSGTKGNEIVNLAIIAAINMLLLFILDSGIIGKMFYKYFTYMLRVRFQLVHAKSEDVSNEEESVKHLINSRMLSTKVLIVDQIKRWYCNCSFKGEGYNPVLKGVSFTVGKGECFGLVGANGAGKSTLLNILVGSINPAGGNAYVNTKSLISCYSKSKALSKIGYCPQSDGYFPNFSGREMLRLFGGLRGFSGSNLKREMEEWIKRMNLEAYEKKKCGTLSGGNQRKFVVALCLLGNPDLLLLDEPTSGVDPSARSSLWDLIREKRSKGQSLVLITHSIEECETLSTRLAIMTDGQFRCIGETTVLRGILGQGYMVHLKISLGSVEKDREELKKQMNNIFDPGCELTDDRSLVLRYYITNPTVTWRKLFTELDRLKSNSLIESYLVSSTTLEQVFLHFAKDN